MSPGWAGDVHLGHGRHTAVEARAHHQCHAIGIGFVGCALHLDHAHTMHQHFFARLCRHALRTLGDALWMQHIGRHHVLVVHGQQAFVGTPGIPFAVVSQSKKVHAIVPIAHATGI